jgi:hypothetical protein
VLNLKSIGLHGQPTTIGSLRLIMVGVILALLTGCMIIHVRPIPTTIGEAPQVTSVHTPALTKQPPVITEQRLPIVKPDSSLRSTWVRYNRSDQQQAATCIQTTNNSRTSIMPNTPGQARCWAALHVRVRLQEWHLVRRHVTNMLRNYYRDLALLVNQCQQEGSACLRGDLAAITQQAKHNARLQLFSRNR